MSDPFFSQQQDSEMDVVVRSVLDEAKHVGYWAGFYVGMAWGALGTLALLIVVGAIHAGLW